MEKSIFVYLGIFVANLHNLQPSAPCQNNTFEFRPPKPGNWQIITQTQRS